MIELNLIIVFKLFFGIGGSYYRYFIFLIDCRMEGKVMLIWF